MFRCIKSLTAAFVLGGIMISSPVLAAEKAASLPFMGSYVEEHPVVSTVWKPFFKAAEEKFAGKIVFSYHSENSLYSGRAEGIQGVVDGRVAFGCVRPSLHPEDFRLLGVISIPGLVPDAVVGSLVLEDLIAKFPAMRDELPRDSEPFVAWTSAASQINTVKPVEKLADLKGLKIAVWDSVSHATVREFGAIPILVSPADTYWTLQRGMADGVLCPLAPLKAYRLAELVKHHFMLDTMVQGFVIAASHKYWEPMPASMKKWFKAEGGSKMSLALGRSLEQSVDAVTADMQAAGHTFRTLPETDKAEFQCMRYVIMGRWKEYCRDMDADLVDSVLAFARERARFHTEAQKAGTYGN